MKSARLEAGESDESDESSDEAGPMALLTNSEQYAAVIELMQPLLEGMKN